MMDNTQGQPTERQCTEVEGCIESAANQKKSLHALNVRVLELGNRLFGEAPMEVGATKDDAKLCPPGLFGALRLETGGMAVIIDELATNIARLELAG